MLLLRFCRPISFSMNKKYFFLFFTSALSCCYPLLGQSIAGINPSYPLSSKPASTSIGFSGLPAGGKPNVAADLTSVADTAKWINMEVYRGKDPAFVKGQRLAIAIMQYPALSKQSGGIIITIGYKFHKKGNASLPVIGNIGLTSYPVPAGTDPIAISVSSSDISNSKIAFAIGAIDIITWDGKPWAAPTTIEGSYDTSNGKYSIHIEQYRPVTQ